MALFPYSNFHDINLDWIVGKLKKAVFTVNGQAPDDDGNVNLSQISGVTTVNGVGADGAGNVQLTPADVNALPDSYSAPVQSVQGKTGNVILSASDVNAMPIGYTAPVESVNGQTGTVVLDASDVGALPDTYTPPVVSVNGQTGSVVLGAADVSALPDTTVVPTATSQLVNDSGFITSQQAGAVLSVNGKVGTVVLDATDVSALPDTTVIPTKTSELINDAGFITSAQAAPVDSVNGYTGAVVLDASDVGAAPAAAGIPQGGAAGQIMVKNSGNDYDIIWGDLPVTVADGAVTKVSGTPLTVNAGSYISYGKLVLLNLNIHIASAVSNGNTIGTVTGAPAINSLNIPPTAFAHSASNSALAGISISNDGGNIKLTAAGPAAAGTYYVFCIPYIAQ